MEFVRNNVQGRREVEELREAFAGRDLSASEQLQLSVLRQMRQELLGREESGLLDEVCRATVLVSAVSGDVEEILAVAGGLDPAKPFSVLVVLMAILLLTNEPLEIHVQLRRLSGLELSPAEQALEKMIFCFLGRDFLPLLNAQLSVSLKEPVYAVLMKRLEEKAEVELRLQFAKCLKLKPNQSHRFMAI
jgi:hypothetical protein